MASLPESSTFDAGVYQLELTDPVIGGPSGVSNAPLKNLANRTKYLKDHVDALENGNTPAGAATKLATARNISLSGDVSGQAAFDGSQSAAISATVLSASTAQAGKVQLATSAEAIAAANSSKAVTPAGLATYLNTSKMGVVGQVAFFAMNAVPAGWLKCNGSALSRITYADLYAAIGTLYGAGDGSNTFNIPDLRGEFLRGFDDGRGIDSGRTIGSWQRGSLMAGGDNLADNVMILTYLAEAANRDRAGLDTIQDTSIYAGALQYTSDLVNASTTLTTPEIALHSGMTRPRNIALLPCIKF